MNKKNKDLIENIKYSNNETSKKILKNAKILDIIFYLTYIFLTIIFFSLIFIKVRTSVLLIISIAYFFVILDLAIFQKLYMNKLIKETINVTICPEAFFDLNLYNAKKIFCKEKAYNYYLNNIAKAYILLGKTEKATKILKQIDKNKKNISLQGEILQNKIEIAFFKRDLKEFNKQNDNLNKIFRFIPKKFKDEIKLSNKIKQAVLEKNTKEVEDLCESFSKNKNQFTNVMNAYYRGVVLEETGKDNYDEYYKFVADNGNNLMIANQVREKMNIKEKKEVYKIKKHFIYNTYKFITFSISLFICIIWIFYLISHVH